MPRLLSINNYHYRKGGSDVVYFEHAALMEKMGWENAFFSSHHKKNVATQWEKYFVDEIEYGHKEEYSMIQKLAMVPKVIYSIEAKKKIARLINDFRPDIAHTHCIYHHLSPSILPVLREAGVPTVMTAHELKIACPAYKMLNRSGICERCKDGSLFNVIKYRCIQDSLAASAVVALESSIHQRLELYKKNLSKVITPSRFYMEKFIEWGWPRDKFVYIPNYVDASQFTPRFEPGSYFLYFGRLAPEKGVATLMRAAKAAGVQLKLVGTGPEEASLRALHETIASDAEFLGYRSGTELHDLIRGARAVVLPSEWYENAPMSVLESYALGKPVIGARMGGIPEMIVEGETGWLFESLNVDALSGVLERCNSMPDDKLAEFGRAARALVEERFNRTGYVEAIQSVYANLLAGK